MIHAAAAATDRELRDLVEREAREAPPPYVATEAKFLESRSESSPSRVDNSNPLPDMVPRPGYED